MNKLHKELDLLDEYMKIYIQILPSCVQCGGLRIHKPQLPTFQYFKETYNNEGYSLVIPHFKEAKTVYSDNKIGPIHAYGLDSLNGIAYRHYNYWMGCKFFTGNNIDGNYTIEAETLNGILKQRCK